MQKDDQRLRFSLRQVLYLTTLCVVLLCGWQWWMGWHSYSPSTVEMVMRDYPDAEVIGSPQGKWRQRSVLSAGWLAPGGSTYVKALGRNHGLPGNDFSWQAEYETIFVLFLDPIPNSTMDHVVLGRRKPATRSAASKP